MFNDRIRLTSITVLTCSLPSPLYREAFSCIWAAALLLFFDFFFFGMTMDIAKSKSLHQHFLRASVSGI